MKWLLFVLLAACVRAQDPQAFLDYEASFLRPGVDLEHEEREVRRVLEQRGMRVTGRLQREGFIALGAANRRASAVRVITGRGVVLAEDAEVDDLFKPEKVALLEGFGGSIEDYTLVAYTRTPVHQDVGCVALERVLPDASVVSCVLDVSDFGARACVSSLAPGRNGQLRAKIAWPSLRSFSTPQLDVELGFALQQGEQRAPILRMAPGAWLDRETSRYNAVQLTKADFAARHAVGVARAVLAKLAGKGVSQQIDLYRNALGTLLPGSLESQVAGETLRHIQTGWLDAPEQVREPRDVEAAGSSPARERRDERVIEESTAPVPADLPPPDDIVVEPPADSR